MATAEVTGQNVILKPMSSAFVCEAYLSWLNDSEITRHLDTPKTTLEELKQYVARRESNPNVRFWAICDSQTGRHIGNVKLEPIDWQSKTAQFGLLIGDRSAWGKGLGTEVTQLVCDHARATLGLSEIRLTVNTENESAFKIYSKLGFEFEKKATLPDPRGGKPRETLYLIKRLGQQ